MSCDERQMRAPGLMCAIAWVLLAIALPPFPAAAEVRSFGISQAMQLDERVPAVRVYLDADGQAPVAGQRWRFAALATAISTWS